MAIVIPDDLAPDLTAALREILAGPLAWPPVPPLDPPVDSEWVVRWSNGPWTVQTLTHWAVGEMGRRLSPIHLIELTPRERKAARRLLPWPSARDLLTPMRWASLDEIGPAPHEQGDRTLERLKRRLRRQPFDWLAEYDESTPAQVILERAMTICTRTRRGRRIERSHEA